MRMLPGIAGRDLDLFGSSINAVQNLGFKRVELSLQPAPVTGLLDVLLNAGAAGAGLSSFGPVVYAIGDTGHDGYPAGGHVVYERVWRGGCHHHRSTEQRG